MKNFLLLPLFFFTLTHGAPCLAAKDCIFEFSDQKELKKNYYANKTQNLQIITPTKTKIYTYSPKMIAKKINSAIEKEPKEIKRILAPILAAMKTNQILFPNCTWKLKNLKTTKKTLKTCGIYPIWIQYAIKKTEKTYNDTYTWCWNASTNTTSLLISKGHPTKNSCKIASKECITATCDQEKTSCTTHIKSKHSMDSCMIRCITESPARLTPKECAPLFIDHKNTSDLEIYFDKDEKPHSYNWIHRIKNQEIICSFEKIANKKPLITFSLFQDNKKDPIFTTQLKKKSPASPASDPKEFLKKIRKLKRDAQTPPRASTKPIIIKTQL